MFKVQRLGEAQNQKVTFLVTCWNSLELVFTLAVFPKPWWVSAWVSMATNVHKDKRTNPEPGQKQNPPKANTLKG